MKRASSLVLTMILPLLAQGQTAPDLVTQAGAKKAHGDFPGALADYTQAIALDPRNVAAYLGRGTVRSLEGDIAGALADDNKAVKLDPDNPIVYGNRGNALIMQGDLAGALADYSQAIALDPHHVRAFINRGNIKNIQKKYDGAIEDYSKAIALDSKSVAAYYNRGGARRAVGDYEGAVSDFSEAILRNPVDAPAYINRAVLEMAQQDWANATADLTKCATLIPADRQAYIRAYLWVITAKQSSAAKATTDLAHQDIPQKGPLAESWGWEICKFLADKEDEKTFLTSAISFEARKNKGQEAQALYFAGLKRTTSGDTASATKFFQQCVKTGSPSLNEYILARAELKKSGASHP